MKRKRVGGSVRLVGVGGGVDRWRREPFEI